MNRQLVWHGAFIFFLGMAIGLFIPRLRNPRMGLSAHLAGVTTGTFFVAVAAVWGALRLGPRAETAAYALALFAGYGSTAAVFLGGVFGTSRLTPIAGAGHTAEPWQKAVVNVGLVSTLLAFLVFGALLLWGFRGA